MARLHLKVGGMHCSFCSQSIERAYRGTAGVEDVSVSLAHEEALVDYDASEVDETALRDVLRDVGYSIRDRDKEEAFEQQQEELRSKLRRTLMGGAASALIALLMVGMWIGLVPREMPTWSLAAEGALAAWVLFWPGREIVSMALAGVRRRIFNQHVLLLSGALGAFVAGVFGLLGLPGFPTFHFFGVAIFLMTYHLLSGWSATKVRAGSQEAVRQLLDLRPETARRVEDGEETEVAVSEVEEGDRVRVKPGESVPLDGRVAGGRSTVDESVVTGEPMPAEKAEGDEVVGGSINQSGTLVVEVTKTGEEGFLNQVARHVEEARALKPDVIQLVDWVLQYYVPAVLLVGLAGLLFWTLGWWWMTGAPEVTRGVYSALTVYVMGYPCALGMATPLALIRGGGMAAEQGILMRSAESFQVFKDVDTVALDKTGTITEGEPWVAEVVPLGARSREAASVGSGSDGAGAGGAGSEREAGREVLRLAAIAEQPSEHPLADAILDRAEEEGLDDLPLPDDFEAMTGKGVRARLRGDELLVGTPDLLEERGVDVEPAREALEELRSRGQTAVLVAAAGGLLGVIGVSDRVKDDSADAVARLKQMDVEPLMMTGDDERTARAVAREVGIEGVLAGVLPDEKADEVGTLQGEGRRVAFVGDGINDAPVLARADVGVAIGAGTDIALESADVVLVHSRLSGVPDAFEVSRRSYRKTKQNLALAFSFNGIGVPVAVTGLLHPAWAMAAMVASVSLVLVNSFAGRSVRGGLAGATASLLLGLSLLACGAGTDDGNSEQGRAADSGAPADRCTELAGLLEGSGSAAGTTCRVTFPRENLSVELLGATLPTSMSLTSWAAFGPAPGDSAVVMGDLALTSTELPRVMAGLRSHGLRVTAVHRHMVGESPPMSFTHYLGVGEAGELARSLRSALDRAPSGDGTGEVPEVGGSRSGLEYSGTPAEGVVAGAKCARIARTLGVDPDEAATGPGYCKVSRPRTDLEVTVEGIPVAASLEVGSWFAFRQTAAGDSAVVAGDMALTQGQVNPAIAALRQAGIEVVALHNHMLHERPRITYFHFQERGASMELARGLQSGLEAAGLLAESGSSGG